MELINDETWAEAKAALLDAKTEEKNRRALIKKGFKEIPCNWYDGHFFVKGKLIWRLKGAKKERFESLPTNPRVR